MNRQPPKSRRGGSRRSSKPRTAAPPLEPSTSPPDIESFAHWPLGAPIHAAIEAMDIHRPTPIQALSIGPILEGRDVIAKAETGTGKTLAFGAPILAKVDPSRKSVLALVLCPTRELSEQVHSVLTELGAARGVRVALIVGGEEMRPQVDALKGGAQVVVGTPGRVLDLMRQGFLSFPWTEYVVLDEADKMLEIGFLPDVEKILAATPEERHTLLFSATFPAALLTLARRATRDPAEVATASGVATVDTIQQYYIEVGDEERVRTLSRMIEQSAPKDVFLIFCDRRTDVDRLMRRMERERFSVKSLHGGYDQAARFRVMSAFRTGEVKALLATDVASRGLDVHQVTHVVNFSAPRDLSDYTHRIGRTGRAGRRGTAITLVPPVARSRWRSLVGAMPWKVEQLEDLRALRAGGSRRERAHEPERVRDRASNGAEPRRERRTARAEDREVRETRETRGDRTDRDSRRSRAGTHERSERAAERPAHERRVRHANEETRSPRAAAAPHGSRSDRDTREKRHATTEHRERESSEPRRRARAGHATHAESAPREHAPRERRAARERTGSSHAQPAPTAKHARRGRSDFGAGL